MAGGKGGVGKSTVAAALHSVTGLTGVDLDVSTPNLHVYTRAEEVGREEVTLRVPSPPDSCSLCGACAEVCPSGALVVGRTVDVDPGQCHGCGLCVEVCPEDALGVEEVVLGWVVRYRSGSGRLLGGEAVVGERRLRAVARAVLEAAPGDAVLDGPAGAGKDVYDALRVCDAVVAVTVPTPAGFRDLERFLRLVEGAGLEEGVVFLNRSGLPGGGRWARRVERVSPFPVVRGPEVEGDPLVDEGFLGAVSEACSELGLG